MYNFKDTTIQAEAGSKPLPAEAMQINGGHRHGEPDHPGKPDGDPGGEGLCAGRL